MSAPAFAIANSNKNDQQLVRLCETTQLVRKYANDTQIFQILARLLNDFDEGFSTRAARQMHYIGYEHGIYLCSSGPTNKASDEIPENR